MANVAEQPRHASPALRARDRAAAAIARLAERTRAARARHAERVQRLPNERTADGETADTDSAQTLAARLARLAREGGDATVATLGRAGAAAGAGLVAAGERLAVWSDETRRALTVAGAAARFHATETALPWLRRTLARARETASRQGRLTNDWSRRLALRARARLAPAMLREDYRGTLLFVHDVVLDRQLESLLFVPTRERVPLARHRVVNLRRLDREVSRATPQRVFELALAAVPEPNLHRFAFVDPAAGRGRDLLLASHMPFEKAIGYEPDPQAHNDCEMNIAQYPRSRMKCRDVTCVAGDLSALTPPEQNTVYYLFRPFDEAASRHLLDRVADAYARQPRRLYVVCVGGDDGPIAERAFLTRLPIARRLAWRIALTSPYPISVFRSLA